MKEKFLERSLDLIIRIKRKGFDAVIRDNETGSEKTIACEDMGSCRIQDIKDCHIDVLREIQFWVDTIREDACNEKE